MSELRSAVDALRSGSLSERSDARIEEDFVECRRARELLEAYELRLLAEIERRGIFSRDGHLSVAAWVVHRFKVAWGVARKQVRLARALADMPESRAALEEGEVSMSALGVLAAARDTEPEAFRASEAQLVEAARIHSVADLGRVTAYWRQVAEAEHVTDDEDARLRARRRLHASVTFSGTVRLDGDLDPETGETLLTALRAVTDAEARSRSGSDERTPAQRRADALGEICRGWLDLAPRPTVAGERPHVTMTVDAATLTRSVTPLSAAPSRNDPRRTSISGFGEVHTTELDHVGPVHAETARRLACDASVMRVVLAGDSEPLDVGRRTPVVAPAIRRAVIVRDRHCPFPGCDRPHTWCDAHHVWHWADGGPTSVPNLLLLCRRHHRMIHDRDGFGLTLVDGRPVFRRPDGSVLEDRAPP